MTAAITIKIVPDETLSASDIDRIVAEAESKGMTPSAFVAKAIRNALPHSNIAATRPSKRRAAK